MVKYIITTSGGLGNQMINYALYRYLNFKKKGSAILYPTRDVGLYDVISSSNEKYHRKWYIDLYLFLNNKLLDPLYRRIRRLLHLPFEKINLRLPIKIVEFSGWDDYTFIEQLHKEYKVFDFQQINQLNQDVLDKIKNTNSVSIHIRRGDYQNELKWKVWIGDICDEKYYSDAIQAIEQKISNPTYFIFSDDIEWTKKNISIKNANYIDWNKGSDSYIDMQLMSYCKSNIIANSTFSLMGSLLNQNDSPNRIAPQKWANNAFENTADRFLVKTSWILIDNKFPKISIIAKNKIQIEEVHNVLQQKYTDFELIIPNTIDCDDFRVKCNTTAQGKYIIEVDSWSCFKNDNYLHKWIEEIAQKEICKK